MDEVWRTRGGRPAAYDRPVHDEYRFVDRWLVRARLDDAYDPASGSSARVLKPLFRWNHGWAMKHGERGVNALFDARRAPV